MATNVIMETYCARGNESRLRPDVDANMPPRRPVQP